MQKNQKNYFTVISILLFNLLFSPPTFSQPSHINIAFNLIKKFEKCKTRTYYDSGGSRTIGYGFKNHKKHSMSCQEAASILSKKIQKLDKELNQLLKVNLTPHQRAAILSLVYNIGITAFRKSSVLKMINNNKILSIKQQWISWSYVKSKRSKGLRTRRLHELDYLINK